MKDFETSTGPEMKPAASVVSASACYPIFFAPPRQSDFMDAVMQNDMAAIQAASMDGLECKDLERALVLLERYNADWQTRPAGDLGRAVITGLSRMVEQMKHSESLIASMSQ